MYLQASRQIHPGSKTRNQLIEQVCREEELKYDEIKGIFDYISSQRQKKTGNQ